MFKLPTCPYCNTVYRYGDVKKTLDKKTHKCYHCGKIFKISKKGIALWFVLLVAAGAVVNLLELLIFNNINFTALTITNVVIIFIFMLFVPYFIKYKMAENTDKNKR